MAISADLNPQECKNKLPHSKLGVSKDVYVNFPKRVTPECLNRGPDPDSPGFPLKACGNDGLRICDLLNAASCGE
jgi:hypothetical protein